MIEPTDEMRAAVLRWRPRRGALADDLLVELLAIIEREHVILPRGAQPLCCDDHPEAVIRWGTCPVCVAETPPGERT